MEGLVFERIETKYMLTRKEYEEFLLRTRQYIHADSYGDSVIQSLYYDTDNYSLIRKSIEKPAFKEKLRLRSYGLVPKDGRAFLEMKRKYEDTVYKRRITISENGADEFMHSKEYGDSQIAHELSYFRDHYKTLTPKVLLIYDRIAYVGENELRVTFDTNIRYRTEGLTLSESLDGKKLLDDDCVLMEIKAGLAYPVWLSELLAEMHIYKGNFSKYGYFYTNVVMKGLD